MENKEINWILQGVTLKDHIACYHAGNQADFARHMGVTPQQVTKWINDGWLVSKDTLYSPKRTIPEYITGGGSAEA